MFSEHKETDAVDKMAKVTKCLCDHAVAAGLPQEVANNIYAGIASHLLNGSTDWVALLKEVKEIVGTVSAERN